MIWQWWCVQRCSSDLMTDNQNVFLSFKLHNNGLETDHNVPIGLATCLRTHGQYTNDFELFRAMTSVSVIEFVIISVSKILGIRFLSTGQYVCDSHYMKVTHTSISSYVIPSHTPASNSSRDFQVNLLYGNSEAVCMVRCNVDVQT